MPAIITCSYPFTSRPALWNLLLTPLVSYGLRGRKNIFPHLCHFDRYPPELWEINSASEPSTWDDDMALHFAVTKADKLYASRQHNWNREECLKLRIFYPSFELEFLAAFCWDTYIGTFLILCHPIAKIFWGYKSVARLPYPDRLVKLGDNGRMLFWIIKSIISIDSLRFKGTFREW